MPFQLAVAADVYGTKFNKLLSFPLCPSMSELLNAVESVFDTCARANRPAGYADVPFKAQALQLHHAVEKRWVDVCSTSQLADGSQMFCFQPNSIWHTDSEGPIPAPDTGITWVSAEAHRQGDREGKDTGPPPSLSEKLRSVFHNIDSQNTGVCRYADVREALMKCGMEFTTLSSADVFRAADADGDGNVTYDEWVTFALDNPSIVDAMFFRMQDSQKAETGWLVSVTRQCTADKERARASQLETLHSEAAWARERVKSLRDYELARREASVARLSADAADAKKALKYSNFVHSQMGP
eukprot:TRINITY_DN21688_c0_g1_i1.p1 TRINITY_DN21688_c0_g1~~TRINITY_DN21688_c0_g1_i1.p1  ORF type:complete len:298 (+),score=102.44 TRINITY_DN21688_c0_g1_i1:90-983(+)